jgi:hypothetical protein
MCGTGVDDALIEYMNGRVECAVAQVVVQGMALAFAIVFLVGACKVRRTHTFTHATGMQRQQGYIVLWIMATFVLVACETVVLLYENALRQQTIMPPTLLPHVSAQTWDTWDQTLLAFYILKLATHVGHWPCVCN